MSGDAVVNAVPADRHTDRSSPPALSILLVDDEVDLLVEIARYLRRRGHCVETAGSHADAEALIDAAARPDVLITDVRMPGGTGLDLARRARRRHPPCRVIVMTGHLAEDHLGAADDLGDAAVLFKPFSFSRLLAQVSGAAADYNTVAPAIASATLSSAA